MRVDVGYLNQAIKDIKVTIQELESELALSKEHKCWRRRFGSSMKLSSRDQLSVVLYDEMGYTPPTTMTATGKIKSDKSNLETLDIPFVTSYLRIERLKKALGTYLLPIKRETVDGFLYAFYLLNKARTYRGSSDNPNFQNIPVRDPEIANIIRRCFVPRKGNHLVEIDYGGIEVKVAACYNLDPNLISYIKDKTKDMHRDMAGQCFMLKPDQVDKMARYCGKNMFVFPQFYGSMYTDCALSLWQGMQRMNLKFGDISLLDHLASKGITELGSTDPRNRENGSNTFVNHIKKIEKHFWEKRFAVYAQWKRDWHQAYLERGWFQTKTGFVIEGILSRNDVINYPVQGSAFHCLLKSLIQLVKKTSKWDSGVVGQIHDSMLSDVTTAELQDYMQLSKYIMTEWLPSVWDWIVVPLEIEAEVSPVDGSWLDKKVMEI